MKQGVGRSSEPLLAGDQSIAGEPVDAPIRVMVVSTDPMVERVAAIAVGSRRRLQRVGARSFEPLQSRIGASRPDVVVLDLRDLANPASMVERLDRRGATLVVLAAAADLAYRALQCEAIDYLIAPVSEAALGRALDRATALVLGQRVLHRDAEAANPVGAMSGPLRYRERIRVRVGGRIVLIPVADLHWVEARASGLVFHTATGSIAAKGVLAKLDGELDPARFVRIHRGAIIRLDQVDTIARRPSGDYDLGLKGGAVARLSRRRSDLLERFGG